MAGAELGTRLVVGFWRGFTFPFRGAKFVYRTHPGLVRIWIFPILITCVALAAAITCSFVYGDNLLDAMWATPTGEGVGASIARVFHLLLELLLKVLLVLVGAVLVALMSSVFAAPFNDPLSEAVETLATGNEMPSLSFGKQVRSALRGIVSEIGKLAAYACVMVPLFAISILVPGAGQVVYSIVGFWLTAVYFAIDYVDWPAQRRNGGFRYRVGMVRRHMPAMLGFGCGVWLLLLIPFVNLFFMPAAVAGGTLLFLELEGQAPLTK